MTTNNNMMTSNELQSTKATTIYEGVYPALVDSFTLVSEKYDELRPDIIVASAYYEVNLLIKINPDSNRKVLKYTVRITPNNISYITNYLAISFSSVLGDIKPFIQNLLELAKTNSFSIKFAVIDKQLKMFWQDTYRINFPELSTEA